MCTADAGPVSAVYRESSDEEKAAFAEVFHDAGRQTKGILGALKDSDDFYCKRVAFVKMNSWSKGHVGLVGDAAYCPSVKTGMGTTSALLGAYILAEIGKHYSISTGRSSGGEGLMAIFEALSGHIDHSCSKYKKVCLKMDGRIGRHHHLAFLS